MISRLFFCCCLCLLACLYSCESEKQLHQDSEDSVTLDTNHQAYKIVNDFYEWYLSKYTQRNAFSLLPNIINTNDSIYSLDSLEYFERLSKLNFFSDGFINKEINLVADCNRSIIKYNWKGEDELDFEGCEFMTYDRFLGGQGEGIDGFKITNIYKISSDIYEVSLESLTGIHKYTSLIITVVETNSLYRIDKITFSKS